MKAVQLGLPNAATQEGLYVALIGPLGGDAASRGVGLRQIAFLQQVSHHVADGGGAHRVFARDGAGGDRLPGVDVVFDERVENVEVTLSQRSEMVHLFTGRTNRTS